MASQTKGELRDRVALVTGAGSGIGREVCRLMAREGARVIAADINQATAEETVSNLAGHHFSVLMDVTSEESVQSAIDFVQKKCGTPASIVVNCAGVASYLAVMDLSEEDFMRVIDINLKGTFLVTKLSANALVKAKKSGSLITFSTIVAKTAPERFSHYSASKAGVEAFTRTVAKELGNKGIRCNAIVPGYIVTPMSEIFSEEERQLMTTLTPMGRPGKPEDVAELVVFLASDKASFITGACIPCTGGLRA